MKKLLLISLITVSLSAKLSAQQYYPLLDSVNRWTYSLWMPTVAPHPLTPYSSCNYPLNYIDCVPEIFTGQDTLIDSITYKQVIVDDTLHPCLYGFIREDTSLRKVYFRDILNNPEIVLYNFLMQVGDTISIHFYNFHYPYSYFSNGRYRLDSIGSINIFSGNRRVFYLHCDTCQNQRILPWIESVGFPGDAIYPYSQNYESMWFICQNLDGNFVQRMNCFEHNYKVYFDSCLQQYVYQQSLFNPDCTYYVDSCHYCNTCTGGIKKIPNKPEISLYPNPTSGTFTLSYNSQFSTLNSQLEIYDVLGQEVYHQAIINQESTTINLPQLSNGVYFYQLSNRKETLRGKFVKE